jgi:hypothetical protein
LTWAQAIYRHFRKFHKTLGLKGGSPHIRRRAELGFGQIFSILFVVMFVAGVPMLFLTGLIVGLSIPIVLVMIQRHFLPLRLISALPASLESEGLGSGSESALASPSRPKGQSDFIFSHIAEEKGFLGSVIVITRSSLISICGSKSASQTRDRLGELLAMGALTMLFSHVFTNIGINVRLMPVTGIPLPLLNFSVSVVCSLIAMGILQKYLSKIN